MVVRHIKRNYTLNEVIEALPAIGYAARPHCTRDIGKLLGDLPKIKLIKLKSALSSVASNHN